MITSTTNNNVFSLIGLSTDTKPIGGIIENGSTFYEIDTCKTYIYDKTNQVWVAQKSTVPVVIDVTSDMIDSEDATSGQVLTADGNGGAEWSDIPTPTITVDNIDSEDSTLGQVATSDGSGGVSWEDIPVPTISASDVNSGSATSGQVLAADGSGGASWQNQSGGGGSTYYQEKVLCDVTSKQELYDLIDNSNEMFKSFLSTVPGEGSYNLYDNLMARTGFYVKFKSSATFVNEEDESDTLTLSDIGLSNAEIRGYCGFHEFCNYWDTYFSGLAYDGGIRINICAYVDNQYIGELYLSMSVTEVEEEVEELTYTISFDTVELETNFGEKHYALVAEDNTNWFDVIDELVVFM